jgi:hypothetical protein
LEDRIVVPPILKLPFNVDSIPVAVNVSRKDPEIVTSIPLLDILVNFQVPRKGSCGALANASSAINGVLSFLSFLEQEIRFMDKTKVRVNRTSLFILSP